MIPHEPTWPDDALTYEYYRGLLGQWWRGWLRGTDYAFQIFLRGADGKLGALISGIWLGDIRRGYEQKATLGYWIGQSYAGQGYMTEAARLVCDFAFNKLGLHRIEASCTSHNEPSRALLKRLGFKGDDFAKDYLHINGRWQEHILWSKILDS